MFVFYRIGSKNLYYDGQKSPEDIFAWAGRCSFPPSFEINCEEWINADTPINKAVIFYGSTEEEGYKTAFSDVAYHGIISKIFAFYHTNDDECAAKLGFTSKPQILVFRDYINPEPSIYQNILHPMYMMKWLWQSITPNVFEFSDDSYPLAYY